MRNRISLAIVAGLVGLVMLPACGSGNQGNTGAEASTPAPSVSSQAAAPNATPAAVAVNSTPALESQKQNARNKNGNGVSKAPQPQIGAGGGDLFMFTQARAALSADAELKTANIVIEVNSGSLTLNGTVANMSQKSKAEQLVRGVAGVKAVKNQLRISN